MLNAPVSTEERIALVDALRGFALCGILVHNIGGFSGFYQYSDAFPDAAARFGPGTELFHSLTKFLVTGKFYSIFSLLFGLGFSIQLARSEEKPGWRDIYVRRLLILFLIGAIHALLLWYGDILCVYALLGFALLGFRNLKPRIILTWALLFLLMPIAFYALCYLITPGYNTDDLIPGTVDLPTAIELYATSSYAVILKLNLLDLLFESKWRFFTGRFFSVVGMFLLGLWAGRLRILQHPEGHGRLLKGVLCVGLVVGLAANFISMDLPSTLQILTLQGVYKVAANVFSAQPLALAYSATFALLWQMSAGQRILSRFVPMGRMALSNYLMQTIMGIVIYLWLCFRLVWADAHARHHAARRPFYSSVPATGEHMVVTTLPLRSHRVDLATSHVPAVPAPARQASNSVGNLLLGASRAECSGCRNRKILAPSPVRKPLQFPNASGRGRDSTRAGSRRRRRTVNGYFEPASSVCITMAGEVWRRLDRLIGGVITVENTGWRGVPDGIRDVVDCRAAASYPCCLTTFRDGDRGE